MVLERKGIWGMESQSSHLVHFLPSAPPSAIMLCYRILTKNRLDMALKYIETHNTCGFFEEVIAPFLSVLGNLCWNAKLQS